MARPFPAREPDHIIASNDPEADPVAIARELVLRELTTRARSRAELEQKLARKGVPEAATREVLDRFTEVGLVNDEAFAGQWVEAAQRRQRSRRGLRDELRHKGVDAETVSEAVAQVSDDDEYASALALARRRASATRGLALEVRHRRVLGALARRGFASGIAQRATRAALAEADDSGDTMPVDDEC